MYCKHADYSFSGAEVSSKATGRLSPIPELDPWEREADTDSTEFTYSLCSVDRYSTAGSSSSSLSDSQERGGESRIITPGFGDWPASSFPDPHSALKCSNE